MTWQFPLYTPAFIINVALSLWLAVMVWNRPSIPGVRFFALTLLAAGLWAFARLFEAGAVEVWAKIFWGKVEYLGIVFVSPAWFVFSLLYTGRLKRISRSQLALLIIPLITLSLTWTNEQHHLIWTEITRSATDPNALNYGHGLWFWVAVVYNYVLLTLGIGALIYSIIYLPKHHSSQAKFLILGAIAPIIGNILYLLGLSPIQGLDLTPFCLTVTAAVYTLTVFRYRLFDIRHVARTAIIENMRDGMLILDEKYRVVDINPSAMQLLGISKSIVGKDMLSTLNSHPELVANIINPTKEHVTLSLGANNSPFLDLQVSPVNDAQGNPTGKLVVLRDVTERHLMEKRAFEVAIEQTRLDLLSQFIRDVSHEFKTPLSVINNSLYLMDKSTDEQQQKKRRDVIQLQIQRLNYLISEMLTTVQLDADYPVESRKINLHSFLTNLAGEYTALFKSRQQRFILQSSDFSSQIVGDAPLLAKALSNILENAARYSSDGAVITLKLGIQPKFALIEITDSGIGMNDETLKRVFERFYRANDDHSTPGFGLGLPIARSIVERHNGHITVSSSLGQGTTVSIWLPRHSDERNTKPLLQFAST